MKASTIGIGLVLVAVIGYLLYRFWPSNSNTTTTQIGDSGSSASTYVPTDFSGGTGGSGSGGSGGSGGGGGSGGSGSGGGGSGSGGSGSGGSSSTGNSGTSTTNKQTFPNYLNRKRGIYYY